MEMIEYPKIETLFNRDNDTFRVKEEETRLPEFDNVKQWRITEKIDGTNVRIGWDGTEVSIGGRTKKAQMPTFLYEYLTKTFTKEKLAEVFPDKETVILFGEGYGARIQKGGNYRPNDVSFRLFDVKVGNWWLEYLNIMDIATQLGIRIVPSFGIMSKEGAVKLLKEKPYSIVAGECGNSKYVIEGIVAKSEPLMLRRNGRERVMWKLKICDYEERKCQAKEK